ncbi:unnamed protein product, partial [marine sediment metagenome]
GLPDQEGRLAILRLHTARMPILAVRLEELAAETDGMSPADLKALCQEAALAAMARGSGQREEGPGVSTSAVTHDDFREAVGRLGGGSPAGAAL